MLNDINSNLTKAIIFDGVPNEERMNGTEAKKRPLDKTQEVFEREVASTPLITQPSINSKSLKKKVKRQGKGKISTVQDIIQQNSSIQAQSAVINPLPKSRASKIKEVRILEDGTILNGLFVNGIFKSGTLTDRYGTIHTGQFKNNKLEGTGVMEFRNGTKKIGDFKNGHLHGII